MREAFTTTPGRFGATVDGLVKQVLALQAEAVPRAMFMAANLGRTEAVKALAAVDPEPADTGQLRRSFVVVRLVGGAVLQNTAEHAAFMEFGTRPHWAPIGPLLAWARRKLRGMGRPGAGKQGPIQRVSKKTREAAVRALAFGAQRSIAAKGTKPRGFYAAASAKFPEFVERALLHELNKLAAAGLRRGLS